jgi:RHS repeat-associated protein
VVLQQFQPGDKRLGQFATGQNERWSQANRYRSAYTYDANGNIETVERYDADGTGHYDSFAYHYHTNGGRKQQNRLYELIDDAPMSTGSDIVTTATGFDNTSNGVNVNNNYGYDALGNLVRDDREEIELIHWTVAGKVDSIQRPGASSRSPLKFRYGASGQRVSKQVGDFYCTEPGSYREHYIRDAQGNIMATYRYTNTSAASLKLNERPLYGSRRLGSLRTELELRSLPSFDPTSANPVQQVDLNYELTDHLGNVCAVVTGRLLDGNGGGTPKQAELVSAQGYEAFGSLLPGRNYSSSTYAFGFNGMRKDDEIHGATGTSYDFGARLYDPRVGRWLSLDPLAKKYPNVSPYVFAEGNPIYFNDPTGKDAEVTIVGNTITIRAVINIYGSGATAAVASQMQSDIMGAWSTNGGKAWTYTDPGTGSVYNVKFDVTVQLYKGQEGIDPFVIPESWNPSNTENFIEVGDDVGRSYVMGGDEGSWRSKGRGDLSLAEDDSAPHEFGHLLGLADRYNKKGPKAGWEGNIMAEPAMAGAVEQRNIDAIVAPILKEFNDAKQMDAALTEAGPRAVGRLGFVPVNGAYQEYKKTGTYKTKIDDCCDK